MPFLLQNVVEYDRPLVTPPSTGGATASLPTVPATVDDSATVNQSAAIQDALNSAATKGNPSVFVPRGLQLCTGPVNVPDNVTLYGNVRCASNAWGEVNPTKYPNQRAQDVTGTLAFRYASQSASSTAFVTTNTNSSMVGLAVKDLNQTSGGAPVDAPYAINMVGKAALVQYVNLVNVTDGIHAGRLVAIPGGDDANKAERHQIYGVTGQPARVGIKVRSCLDVCRIENIHFVPQYANGFDSSATADQISRNQWISKNGTALWFLRSDGQMAANCFGIFYGQGIRLEQETDSPLGANFNGSTYGTFNNCDFDLCGGAAVVLLAASPYGVRFIGCDFTGMSNDAGLGTGYGETRAVYTGGNFASTATFDTCALRNAGAELVWNESVQKGLLELNGCRFESWNKNVAGRAAINAFGNSLITVNAPYFGIDAKQYNTIDLLGNATGGRIISSGGTTAGNPNATGSGVTYLTPTTVR